MTRSLLTGLWPLLAICALGCKGESKNASDLRDAADPALASVQVGATVESDQGGVVQALVTAADASTQVVHASATGPVAGSLLSFPPGSFDVDETVTFSEGQNLATPANVQLLAPSGSTVQVEAAALGVLVAFSTDQSSLLPYTVTIPAPTGQGTLVVLALLNQPAATEPLLGFIPSAELQVTSGFVTFTAENYGNFQAVMLTDTLAPTATSVAVQETVGGPAPGANLPAAFAVTGPTDALTGAHPVVTWQYAPLADSYTVALDAQDPACGHPYKTYPGVTATSQTVTAQSGTTYVCITASNSSGATKQNNPGFKFQADATPPPVPAAPSCTVDTDGTSLTCTWSAVEDGSAPAAGYVLQIGTTQGGSDVYNAALADTSKAVPVNNSATYYAQVASLDSLGNESAFSPGSAPVSTGAAPPGDGE